MNGNNDTHGYNGRCSGNCGAIGSIGLCRKPGCNKERLTALIHHDEHCVYVAVLDDMVAGWIHGCYLLRVETDRFVEIGGLVVHEAYRNRGIGKELVETVIRWAETRQCRRIRVRCNVIRRESHRFYERIGFIENKQQKIFDKLLIDVTR
ncbi:MAG: GNAT family N-acetyltransferase [Calditrichae bacterium]|nr:GNAT family N-acetyltransferase [Calditrichia bacterium]